jgi:PASTA domain
MPPFLSRLLLGFVLTFALAGPAHAASTATTLPAAAVSHLSADLRGSFSTDQWGEWWFEYGPTVTYGAETSRSGFSPGAYTPALRPQLQPGTTYHFRIVVREGLFTGPFTYYYGEDREFTTLPPTPPQVVETPSTVHVFDGLRGASISLGIANGALPTEAWVEWGLGPSLGTAGGRQVYTPSTEALHRSFELSPLVPYTTYYFRVFAENALGRAQGSLRSVTTGAPGIPPSPPPVPPAPQPPAPPPPPPSPSPAQTVSRCLVPRARGLTVPTARSRIARAHCRVGAIRRTFSTVRKGRIVSQSPAAGRRVVAGTRVKLVVSRGRRRA